MDDFGSPLFSLCFSFFVRPNQSRTYVIAMRVCLGLIDGVSRQTRPVGGESWVRGSNAGHVDVSRVGLPQNARLTSCAWS